MLTRNPSSVLVHFPACSKCIYTMMYWKMEGLPIDQEVELVCIRCRKIDGKIIECTQPVFLDSWRRHVSASKSSRWRIKSIVKLAYCYMPRLLVTHCI